MNTVPIRLAMLGFALALFAASSGAQAASLIGVSKQQIFDAYGAPTSQMKTGTKEVLVYPNGRVVLQDGVVSAITLPLPPEPKPAAQSVNASASHTASVPALRPTSHVQQPGLVGFRPPSASPIDTSIADMYGRLRLWGVLIAGSFAGIIALKLSHRCTSRKAQSLRDQLLNSSPTDPPTPSPASKQSRALAECAERLEEFHRNENRNVSPALTVGLRTDIVPPTTLDQSLLFDLEWRRFELLLAGYFTAIGLKATRGAIGADGGIDIFLHNPGEEKPTAIVQCKAWRRQIRVNHLRELFGVMAAEGITEGYFVTAGTFTRDALEFARGKPLKLFNGSDVVTRINALRDEPRLALLAEITVGDYITPTCASCDVKMVKVVKHSNGQPFWGCRHYPRCRSMLSLRSSDCDESQT